jgi:predicted ester cyclase
MTNAEIILECLRRFEAGDVTGCGEFFDDELVASIPGTDPLNKAQLLALSAVIIEAFPDFTYSAKVIETQGDTVKMLLTPTGTQSGILRYPGITPLPPTGISIALPKHLCTYTVRNGKIVKVVMEDTSDGGLYGLLQTLGISLSEDGG